MSGDLKIFFDTMGWLGTAFAIAMFLPQVYKVVRTGDTSTLSRASFGVYAFGCSMWVIFCGVTEVWQGFASNGVNLILMNLIFFYMFKGRQFRWFVAATAFTVATFAVALVLAFVVGGSNTSLAVNYVFVVLAGASLGVAFVPQVKTIFFMKDFRSYSFFTSNMLNVCNVFWVIFWIGKLIPQAGTPQDEIAQFVLALIFTAAQIVVQVAAMPVYFASKKKGTVKNASQPKKA